MKITKNNKALAIRTCGANGTSRDGFQWPSKIGSVVTCSDWNPVEKCGNGLHALLDGWGDYRLLSNEIDALWQIVEIDRSKCVELDGKVKFESCVLKYSGEMAVAMTMISDYQIALLIKNTDGSKLAASGYGSKLAASGYGSKLAASGDDSKLAASGDDSKLAASGKKSISVCAGLNGSAFAGEDGCIALAWWDSDKERYRLNVGYVGEGGIEEGKIYKLDNHHKFIEA